MSIIWYIVAICAFLEIALAQRNAMEKIPPSPTDKLLFNPSDPIVKSEFSVILYARDSDCYYHYVPKYAKMQFQYRVITPPSSFARNVISVEIKDPNGMRIYHAHFRSNNEMSETPATESGVYEICLHNSLERFGEKKVRVLFSYLNEDSFEEMIKEQNETDATTDAMTLSSHKIAMAAMRIYRHLYFQKLEDGAHMEQMSSMLVYVGRASIVTCFVIALTAWFQTFALKRMFQETTRKTQARA
uniref:uncharacterized protein LOC120329083 n=1 Tax=Styela clava TaxID=7725 RepID=UPI00193A898D|nr:uncharacterized protein LOC120329083 [Styela clava]